MANRLLTVEEMIKLCNSISPEFAILSPDNEGHTTVFYRRLTWHITAADRLLSDNDFIDRFPKRMLEASAYVDINSEVMVQNLLDDRGKTYGDYSKMSNIIQSIKANMRAGSMNDKLTHGQREALEMIATKIGRIVEGDPNHIDSWRDIAGYATLAADRIAIAPAKKGDLK